MAAFTGVQGKLLDGASKYTLRFDKGQLPPVNEFWSVTMYGAGVLSEAPIERPKPKCLRRRLTVTQ
ncbi:DUF1214 domain-containing protein [Rhizobium laguerreae]|uniref:DUF1214 domain-containing protein n=1 Tax=Rhizobium laguerreae TaxID=1076926 RepID=UPI0028A97CF8|nr:DUF1214 domain-containing protein [Rhizobium laguerreae]